MKKYNVSIENVIRHYDVTHKVCQAPYVKDLKAWETFKERLDEDDEMIEKITVKVNGKNYKADRILKEDKNFLCIKDLEQADFEIGYDRENKILSILNRYKELEFTVDGKKTSVEAVNINGSNFVPIRSLAFATGKFEVNFENGEVIVRRK